jgi:hypothetical protein
MLDPPEYKKSTRLADALIDRVNDLPALIRESLVWTQGTAMPRHAQLAVTKDLPLYFAHLTSRHDLGHGQVNSDCSFKYPSEFSADILTRYPAAKPMSCR